MCEPDGTTVLSGAKIWVVRPDGSLDQTTTSPYGQFLLADVEPGRETLHIQKVDYTAQQDVQVENGQTATLPPVCMTEKPAVPTP